MKTKKQINVIDIEAITLHRELKQTKDRIEKYTFDQLIDELVRLCRIYYDYTRYNNIPFNDDFPTKMKNVWKDKEEELRFCIVEYTYKIERKKQGYYSS